MFVLLFSHVLMQMSMNVPVMKRTTVTPMPHASTTKAPTSAHAFEVMKVMAETAQVLIFF